MNQEKVIKLLKDPEFMKEFLKVDTEEEASKLFALHECPVELGDIDLIARSAALVIKKEGKISDDDVSDVVGGGCSVIDSNQEKLDAGMIIGAVIGSITGAVSLGLGAGNLAGGYGDLYGWAAGFGAGGIGTLGGAAAGAAIGKLIAKILKLDLKDVE